MESVSFRYSLGAFSEKVFIQIGLQINSILRGGLDKYVLAGTLRKLSARQRILKYAEIGLTIIKPKIWVGSCQPTSLVAANILWRF